MKSNRRKRLLVALSLFFILLFFLPSGAGAEGGYTPVAIWGSKGSEEGQFNDPYGIATDGAGNVYVADTGNDRIQKFDSDGNFISKWGSSGTGEGYFNGPSGIATDADGNVYVADIGNDRIQEFDSGGTFLTQWGSSGTEYGEFYYPYGIATDGAGNVYVADTLNWRIQKFDSGGTFLTQWRSSGTEEGYFKEPRGIATDGEDNVYVADTGNDRIQKFDSGGTFISEWGSSGTEYGEFNMPYGIATDGAGNVYVADTYNDRIQEFSPDTTKPTVKSLTLDPPSPVRAGEVSFTLVFSDNFSENMDTAISPTVTFGTAPPYTDRTVTQTSYSADTWVGTFTISTGYDGNQHLSISGAKDLAGNPMDPDPDTRPTLGGDTTKPTVTMTNPSASQTVSSASYTIEGTAADPGGIGAAQVLVTINDGSTWNVANIRSPVGTTSWTYEATLVAGPNVVKARSIDYHGNESNETPGITLTYETDKPTVKSLTLDPPSPVTVGEVTFTIVFSEQMNITISPTVTFGKTDPYDEHIIGKTSYSGKTWIGTFPISTGYDGEQHLSISGAQDLADNVMDPDTTHTFLIDTTSPGGSISINGGATYTNSQSVTLSLSAEDAAQMHFSNDNSSWSSWESYSSSKSWTLSSGDGEKTVYVQFKDSAGNVSKTYSDTIILDTTPPTGTFSINSGGDYTNSRSVTLTFNASSSSASLSLANASPSLMHFSNDNSSWSSWESYSSSKSWTLSSGDGKKTVYAEFKDPAGNVSKTYSGSIILHRTPPTVAITSPCAGSCLKGEVTVEGTATDDYFEKYEIEFAEGLNPSSWHEITSCCFPVVEAELCCWNVNSLSDGTYTLKLTAWDLASNFAEVKVVLKVDNHPPETTLIEYPLKKVTGNIPKAVATFSWIGSDADNITPVEELVYQYRLEGHSTYQDWSGWSKDSASTFLLPSGGYTFKVRAKDEAGNYPFEDDAETARYSFTVSLPLIIYPNPCYLNQAGIVTFSNLPLESEVRVYIYDLGGNLVRTLQETDAVIQGGSKVVTWDLRNNKAEILTRGIYIYYILSATEKRTGKIAIIN